MDQLDLDQLVALAAKSLSPGLNLAELSEFAFDVTALVAQVRELEGATATAYIEMKARAERAEAERDRFDNLLCNLETTHEELRAEAYDADGRLWLDRAAELQQERDHAQCELAEWREAGRVLGIEGTTQPRTSVSNVKREWDEHHAEALHAAQRELARVQTELDNAPTWEFANRMEAERDREIAKRQATEVLMRDGLDAAQRELAAAKVEIEHLIKAENDCDRDLEATQREVGRLRAACVQVAGDWHQLGEVSAKSARMCSAAPAPAEVEVRDKDGRLVFAGPAGEGEE